MRAIVAVLAAAALAGCRQPLQSRPAADRTAADSVRYEIVDLGTLEPSACSHPGECRATAINARGQVVGFVKTASALQRAFLWENGVMRDLGTLGGSWSAAVAINNRGEIAGLASDSAGGTHAVLWTNGVPRDLGPAYRPPYPYSSVRLSETGQVTWSVNTPTGVRAVLWDHEQTVDLGTLGGDATYPNAINNAGRVVGTGRTGSGSYELHAFLWEKGVMRDLGTLVGCCSDPSDINERGQVTGTMYYDGSLNQHAFLWDGDLIDLGTVPGDAGS